MSPDPYSYGDDTRFSEDGVDSVLSRNERRKRHHLYAADRRQRQGNVNSINNNNSNSNKNRRINPPRHITTKDDDSSKLLEEDALDSLFRGVEKGFGLNSSTDASLLANTRRKATSREAVGYRGYDDDDDDDVDGDYYDEEKQHSQQHSTDMDGYYLPTAASPEMRSIDDSISRNTNLTTNAPSNVLAYILGGFGLCPPDQAGMDADAQVSHFETASSTAPETYSKNKSGGGIGTFCMPDKKGLATDAQVSHFETMGTQETQDTLESSSPYEEKKEDTSQKLQETAAFPFNSRQFSNPDRRRLDFQLDAEGGLQQQQLEQDKKIDAVMDTGTQFCAPPDCLTGEKRDDAQQPETDEALPPGMSPQTELPPPPSNAGTDLEAAMGIVRQGSLLDEDDVEESRLDQIRRKKRNIEQQVHPDLPSSSGAQLGNKYKQQENGDTSSASVSLRNKVIISFLVLLSILAAGLVGVSFFWPDLMPKLG